MRFASIDNFPGYRVCSDGRIQSAHRNGTRKLGKWRDLKPSVDSKGYAGLTLCSTVTGSRWRVRVHRLVAVSFIPNPLGLPCVRHLDGNSANNSARNLSWGTYKDNENDKLNHGTWMKRITNAKLTEETKKIARTLSKSGSSCAAIARVIGVTRPTISRLLSGRTWSK